MNIRFMISTDITRLLEIDKEVFEYPWTRKDWERVFRNGDTQTSVVTIDNVVVGYLSYELLGNRLKIASMAIDPWYQRQGLGTALLEKLVDKLRPGRYTRIVTEVRETNLDAQLFLRAAGFKARKVLKEYYENVDEDAYMMEYQYEAAKAT